MLALSMGIRTASQAAVRGQRGGLLLEALVSVALLVGVFSLALQGVAAGARARGTVNSLITAQNTARSQLEYALASTYCAPPCAYPTVVPPAGYTVSTATETYPGADANLEYIVVTVSKGGTSLVTVRGMRANR